MSGNELAALLVALTGVLTAIFAGTRNLRSDKTKGQIEASAQILTGYGGIVESLQAEVSRLNEVLVSERLTHKQELENCLIEHRAEMLIAYERIDELGTQLYVQTNRPPELRERESDERAPGQVE